MKFKSYVLCSCLSVSAFVAGIDMYPITAAPMRQVKATGGFWLPRLETNRLVTVKSDLNKCEEAQTQNFRNFRLKKWRAYKGHGFYDSDLYKVIEGASYTLMTHPDAQLEKRLDEIIADIALAQEPDGYLYAKRTCGSIEGPRWAALSGSHELYNVGHLYEAAVAHYEATGKRTLLDIAIKNADLLCRTFGPERNQLRIPSGHPEIELALYKLARVTGEQKYADLSRFLIDATSFYKQRQVVPSHAVRAVYYYSSLVDDAIYHQDATRFDHVLAVWKDLISRHLYVTGGIGSRHSGEAFGKPYELNNEMAYNETCAQIGLALFGERLFRATGEASYMDVVERVIYNGMLSGYSMKGNEFFYPNPVGYRGPNLQSKNKDIRVPQSSVPFARSPWFWCSCCPVNIVRFIPQVPQFMFATAGDQIYWNLFALSEAQLKLPSGSVKLTCETAYPWEGTATLTVTPERDNQKFTLAVRIPGWAYGRPVPSDLYTDCTPSSLKDVSLTVNGKDMPITLQKGGYCILSRTWQAGDKIALSLPMNVHPLKAHEKVEADRDAIAFQRGPLVYCAEGVDNGGKVYSRSVSLDAPITLGKVRILDTEVVTLSLPAKEESGQSCTLTLIPYYAWCHRGSNEMRTWIPLTK